MELPARDIDKISEGLRKLYPAVEIAQLKVSHPGADDDGLWFFKGPESPFEVQLESASGMCPFLIETDQTDRQWTATSVDEAVSLLVSLLRPSARAN